MERLKSVLSQPGMLFFLFFLGIVLCCWPYLHIFSGTGALLAFFLAVWLLILAMLSLIGRFGGGSFPEGKEGR